MKTKPEKVIADFHIRMVENENGIRIINTDVFGDLDDFAEISQNLVDTKDYNMRTILLLNSMSEYIKMKLEEKNEP
ncbi:hypothetical protein PG630_10735 [Riemerella anatipestifer]|nr:hypothetical protein [Riemerella anatipestifer]